MTTTTDDVRRAREMVNSAAAAMCDAQSDTTRTRTRFHLDVAVNRLNETVRALEHGDTVTAPIFIREAFDNLDALISRADAEYVILRNGCEADGVEALVESFGEPWARRADIRAGMETMWGGCFDIWAVTSTVESLPYFGRCLVLAFVGTHPDHPSRAF